MIEMTPRGPFGAWLHGERLLRADVGRARSQRDELEHDADLAHLLVQYGLLALFAVGCPQLGALAAAANVPLVSASAFRILEHRRELPQYAADLGLWGQLFSAVTALAVLGNTVAISQLLDESACVARLDVELGPSVAWCESRALHACLLGAGLVAAWGALHALTPAEPRWLRRLLGRRKHFVPGDGTGGVPSADQVRRLNLAIRQEHADNDADTLRIASELLGRACCLLPVALHRWMGGERACFVHHVRADAEGGYASLEEELGEVEPTHSYEQAGAVHFPMMQRLSAWLHR